jgi:hypothetical protein
MGGMVVHRYVLLVSLCAASASPGAEAPPQSLLLRSLDTHDLIGKPVTGERWEQVARIERLLLDPASGRATFVVLSFVNREDLIAIPWEELVIDDIGRARLKRPRRSVVDGLRFYGSRTRFPDENVPLALDEALRSSARLTVTPDGRGLLEGVVVGRVSLPQPDSGRHLFAVMEVGGRTLRVDLGSEEDLRKRNVQVNPGESLGVRGLLTSSGGKETLIVSAIRSNGHWIDIGPGKTDRVEH